LRSGRVRRAVHREIRQDGEVLDETDGSGSMTNSNFSEYIFFGSARLARRDAAGNVFYYVGDHLGSSRVIVQAGQTTPCYDVDFYPFGGEIAYTNTCQQNYKFTGKERDPETNLDNFGARFYSSGSQISFAPFGRFLSADWSSVPAPVPYAKLDDPQSLNLYSYVSNNPLTFSDPDGHCWPLCAAVAKLATWVGAGVATQGGRQFSKNVGIGIAKGAGSFAYNTFKGAATAIDSMRNPAAAVSAALTPGPQALAPSNLTQAQVSTATQITLTVASVVAPTVATAGAADTSLTVAGDTFTHYGYLADADSYAGGLRPGSFATTESTLTGSQAQSGLSLPPRASLPDAAYPVTPEPGTPIVGPSPAQPANGQPGGLPEVQFPNGTGPGTVGPPRPVSPGVEHP
jgi:RHS repeat-associated protein